MQPPTKKEFSEEEYFRRALAAEKAWVEANAPEDPQDYLIEGESFLTPQPRRPKPGGSTPPGQ